MRLPDADAGPPDGRPKSNATQVIPAPASNPVVETAVQNPPETIQRSPVRCLWVMQFALICEALPLTSPQYGGEMRIIKHAHGQLENSSPTSSGRPISAARAAAAAQKGLLFALDSTLGRRDIAAKAVGLPILLSLTKTRRYRVKKKRLIKLKKRIRKLEKYVKDVKVAKPETDETKTNKAQAETTKPSKKMEKSTAVAAPKTAANTPSTTKT